MLKSQLSAISEGVKGILKGSGSNKNVHDAQDDAVSFVINGTNYTVKSSDEHFGVESRLVDFIRDRANLKGTKFMCREGGCGACVVTARTKDPHSGEEVIRAVNSCLSPVWSCHGWDISTVEDLGNRFDGYHPIQKRLNDFGGTQCGYCSSGMVMNMYSLAMANSNGLTSQDVEDNFDGNICRCTGYRPIMDAMKSFAVDADHSLRKRCADIEDFCAKCPSKTDKLNNVQFQSPTSTQMEVDKKNAGASCWSCCSGGGCGSNRNLSSSSVNQKLTLVAPSGEKWVKATDLTTVFETIKKLSKNNFKYRIVAGNTGTGVFKYDGPYDAYIEINSIPDLTIQTINKSEAILGGGTTLTRTIEFLQSLSTKEGFEYAGGMAKHIKRVANTPVRNFGTIAGNLMMKYAHNDFPSDIFLLMETVGAKIFVASSPTEMTSHSPVEFLKLDMKNKVIVHLSIPIRNFDHIFRSYKITKRWQNAHAYVNAGFLLKVDPAQNFKVLEKPTITFGGINPEFMRALKTEEALNGVELGNVESLKNALKVLESEIQPDHHLPDATPEYRKALTLSLLYKTILGILKSKSVKPNFQSGGEDLPRKLNSGKQVYDKDEEFKDSPLYKPVHKLEGMYQVSGEAEYVNDIPRQVGELYGAFVTVTVATGNIKKVDASEALKMEGVVKFLQAKDIPGKNNFNVGFFLPVKEELFIESKIQSSGQAVGFIVAETQDIANAAALKVKVEVENQVKPLIKLKDGVEQARKDGTYEKLFFPFKINSPDAPSTTSKHKISGKFEIGGQAHTTMELHVTLAVPKEDGLQVYAAVQGIDFAQSMLSDLLNMPNNKINVEVRRLGGAFGAKTTRSLQTCAAAALAAQITRKPVRAVQPLEQNFEMNGKRLPYYTEYDVGFDDNGKIDSLQSNVFCDPGMVDSVPTSPFAAVYMQNCYAVHGWMLRAGKVNTTTHTNEFCRAPGTTQGIAIIETIMEHIADTLAKDPLEVRAANFLMPGDALLPVPLSPHPPEPFDGVNLVPTLIEEMKKSADYESRKNEIDEFNKNNRWRKRGLCMIPMRYHQEYHGSRFPSYVGIHSQDGTVSVSHGGIEMGNGINTKVAQVVAHEFGIPLEKVVVKPTNNLIGMNASGTGGAITSELCCYATMKSCQMLLERMEPIKKAAGDGAKWEEIVKKSNAAGIDLRATHMYNHSDPVKAYDVYGCNLTEVEVDILTGEYKISRLDLIEDAGKSLSPEVDIGSIVMGLGLWTEEKLHFHPETGRLLTRNTWEYKVPFPKSIPEDMRITIMRNAPNPHGVLRSKATGEPPVCLAVAVLLAIKNAIKAARKDAGNTDHFQLDGPVTPEDIVRLSLSDPHSQFVY